MKKNLLLVLVLSISIGLNAQTVYCSAGGGQDEFISSVEFAAISNSSSSTGYTDFTNISTDIILSETYPITVNNGIAYASDMCGVWIDWNQDFDFDDLDEFFTLNSNSGGEFFTSSITIPTTALLGQTTMRIRIIYSGTLSPCGSSQYGEVEDYSINVLPNCDADASITYYDLGLSIDFSVTSTQNISYDTSLFAINWNLGDGTTNNYQSAFNHTYASPGTYLVTFSVEDLNDTTCFDYDSLYLDVSSCEANAEFNFDIMENDANFYTYFSYDSTLYDIVWDMGDGNFITGQDSINYLFDTTDIYTVSLSITDINDSTCSDTVSYNVNSYLCDLDIDFTYSVYGDVATLITDTAYENGYTITWDMGDGYIAYNDATAFHLYYTQGTFTVTLIVTDNLYPGCTDTVSHELLLHNCYANAGFSYDNYALDYDFIADYTSAGYSYSWDFDDGTINTTSGSSVNHIFPSEDSYDVTLIVNNLADSLCADTVTITIQTDSCAAIASFNSYATSLDANFETVYLIDPTHYTLSWDFGDTTFASGTNPYHTYSAAGIYNVTLIVQNIYDTTCYDSFVQTIQVYDCSFVVADYTYTDNGGFNFDFVLDNNYPTTGYQMFWNLGDGNMFYDEDSINYTFTDPGQYNVFVTVTCFEYPYCENYFSQQICVVDASFGVQTDTLTAMFSIDYNYPLIYSFNWDFGDGTTAQNTATPTHTYAQEDTFTVTLTVTNTLHPNCSAVFSQDVFVTDCPLVADYYYIINDLSIDFSSIFSPTEFILFWDFGDGITTTGLPNISHTYSDYGTYSVCLLVTDIDNPDCFDEICYDIDLLTSINEANTVTNLTSIYPNPVNDVLNIEFVDKTQNTYKLRVFDATGRLLLSNKITSNIGNNRFQIDVSNLPKAVYYFNLGINENESRNYKFVK